MVPMANLSQIKCVAAWASLTLLNSCILRAWWCRQARREGGIESVQRQLNSWCKNTLKTHHGAKRLTRELQGLLVSQILKFTNGDGTKRTRKLKMVILIQPWSNKMTKKIPKIITILQLRPSRTQSLVQLSAKVTLISLKKIRMEYYCLIKCSETRRKTMDA